tara:strand:+ start:347 stop:565 length:219 start_codon:yes stop_codon:yes gene_type:complete
LELLDLVAPLGGLQVVEVDKETPLQQVVLGMVRLFNLVDHLLVLDKGEDLLPLEMDLLQQVLEVEVEDLSPR